MVTPRASKKVLSDLKASILNPALTSHFQCWFYPPSAVRSLLPAGEVQDDRMWSLSCAEAALPGTSIATNELVNDFTGITERHAYRRQYDTTSSFTFYVDHDYKTYDTATSDAAVRPPASSPRCTPNKQLRS